MQRRQLHVQGSRIDGVHFMYLLPLSPTRALVENTYFFPCQVSRFRFESEIRSYLASHHGLRDGEFRVVSSEAGAIPLRPTTRQGGTGRGHYRIGLAGGAARPSSGYAFLRIQRQCRELAEVLVAGHQPAPRPPSKYDFFDTVFLEALAREPQRAHKFFLDLFANTDADVAVRFLSDVSTVSDDLRVIGALPLPKFLLSAIRSAPVWCRQISSR